MRKLLLLAVLAWITWTSWAQRPIEHEAGILAATAPLQENLSRPVKFQHDDFTITRKAKFKLRARVLSKERYRLGTEADLSPVDLALGWGPMSDEQVVGQMDISQGNRWYYFKYQPSLPLSPAAVSLHSSNMHMIPADRYTAKQLIGLRPGAVVSIEGYLVDVDRADGFAWRTSMRRDDTGAGACEIVWVDQILIEESVVAMQSVSG